jgi:hypothetical protein
LDDWDFTWSCRERKKTKEGKGLYIEGTESTEDTEKEDWRSGLAEKNRSVLRPRQ